MPSCSSASDPLYLLTSSLFLKALGADRLALDLSLAGLRHYARPMLYRKPAALPRPRASADDPQLAPCRRTLFDHIGSVQLPTALIEVDGQTRSSWSLLGRAPRSEQELVTAYAALVALGSDLTAANLMHMTPGIGADRIGQMMVRLEAGNQLRQANSAVLKHLRAQPIVSLWGRTASSTCRAASPSWLVCGRSCARTFCGESSLRAGSRCHALSNRLLKSLVEESIAFSIVMAGSSPAMTMENDLLPSSPFQRPAKAELLLLDTLLQHLQQGLEGAWAKPHGQHARACGRARVKLIPFFILYVRTGLVDTDVRVAIAHVALNLSLVVWLLRSFFEALLAELEEAAFVDGASRWLAFRAVCLPLAMPGIAVVGILAFLFSWNEFLFALVLTDQIRTVPVGLYNFVGYQSIRWGDLSADAVLMLTPVLVVVLAFQRRLVRGLTLGAVR